MSAYQPYDPLEALKGGEITYTTAIVNPVMSPETRHIIKKKSEKMGFVLLLLLGAIIAAIFKIHLLYTILFTGFILTLFLYLITAAILHRKIEAYSIVGTITWEKDGLILLTKEGEQPRVIPYESIISLKSTGGIPHKLLAKSKNQDRDYSSIIVEFLLNNESLIVELHYMSNYLSSNPHKALRKSPLTEQLLTSVFSNYNILDNRAIDRY
ncbi:MAG: hypothetical protein IT221_04710 [Fluviicola sp.]|nr:hypothetical protein [Fluviicola sp.]